MLAKVQAFTTPERWLLRLCWNPRRRGALGKRSLHHRVTQPFRLGPYRLGLLCACRDEVGQSPVMSRMPFSPGDIAKHPSSSKRLTVLAASGDRQRLRSHASPWWWRLARLSRPTRHPPEYRCPASSRQRIAGLPWLHSQWLLDHQFWQRLLDEYGLARVGFGFKERSRTVCTT